MIKHVVFFKFKPEAGPVERRAVINQLKALPDKIDGAYYFDISPGTFDYASLYWF